MFLVQIVSNYNTRFFESFSYISLKTWKTYCYNFSYKLWSLRFDEVVYSNVKNNNFFALTILVILMWFEKYLKLNFQNI